MRVNVYPADEGGCGHYRMIWPAQALADREVVIAEEQFDCVWINDPRPRVVDIVRPDCDVAVFQRPTRRHLVEAMVALQGRGVAVVVDVDDLLDTAHPSNPWFGQSHPRSNPDQNWRWVGAACRIADLVTVSTPALAHHYGRHGRVEVLPNCVPASYLSTTVGKVGTTLGYWGSPDTHPGDLERTGAVVAESLRVSGAAFCAIGGLRTAGILGVTGRHVPWRPILTGFPATVASLDVALAPLADSAFNRAKSWLKVIEGAALGVAMVASDLPDYRRAAQEGMCVLATRPREWRRELVRLLTDADERSAQVARAREAAAWWTYDVHAERWWEAWRRAADHRALRSAAA